MKSSSTRRVEVMQLRIRIISELTVGKYAIPDQAILRFAVLID